MVWTLVAASPFDSSRLAAWAQTAERNRQILHVRKLDRGEWIGWIDSNLRRTSVRVPQTKEEIERFASENDLDIEWHTDRPGMEPKPEPEWATSPAAAESAKSDSAPVASTPKPVKPQAATGASATGAPESIAEQSTRLERTIAADGQRLEKLRAELTNPASEYAQAEAEFKGAEQELATQLANLDNLKTAGTPDEVKLAQEMLKTVQSRRDLAQQRFDLAIQTRKTLQEQLTALEAKVVQDRQALDKLTGAVPAVAVPAVVVEAPGATSPAPVVDPAATTATGATPAVAAPAVPQPAPATAAAAPVPQPAPATPAVVPVATAAVPEAAEPPTPPATEQVNAELQEAQQRADQKKEEARVAELEAQSITERLKALDKTIELERKLFVAARKKADIAFQQQHALQEEYQQKSDAGVTRAELQQVAQRLNDAERLFVEARREVAERTDHLSDLQSERTALQAEELAALKDAEQKKGEAANAEAEVVTLQNPFSLPNVLQWLLNHGVRIVLILAGILGLRTLLSLTTRRFVAVMVKSGARGTPEEREDRAKTLVGVFQNAGSMAIMVSGALMICEEVGIAVAPLMGGAAVVGLAFAFGAQNLIRDYFYGFVILLENQYKINDVLKIGDIAGQVERITLRMTVLRDLEGRVHFIPNGKIDSVTNMTHGWSRAVFDIGVAYKEDADAVMDILMDLARDLRKDPQYASMIIDDPEMLGVDAFGDSAVVIKFVLKTRPLKQWAIKRELLRRIKRRFDELGIEIPFPHRTVYHYRGEDDASAEVRIEPRADRRAA